jgi:hypothetical protein
MVLRTTLISLLAFAICQIGYGQSRTTAPAHANATPRALRLASNQPTAPVAAPTVNGSQTNDGAPSTNHRTPAMNYRMETMPAESFPLETTCDDGSCAPCRTDYVPWWHRCFVWSCWKVHGLPSPWCTPGNMSGHIPCNACMGTYYYFRPYNWFHIPDHQQEAANYNGDPRNPYDNRVVFDGLYDGLE